MFSSFLQPVATTWPLYKLVKQIISLPTHFLDNRMVYSCTRLCNTSLSLSPAIHNKVMLILPFLIKTSTGVWDCKILVALCKICVFLFIHTKNYLVDPLLSNWHCTVIYRLWSTKSYHTQCPFWPLCFAILINVPLISGQNAHQGHQTWTFWAIFQAQFFQTQF